MRRSLLGWSGWFLCISCGGAPAVPGGEAAVDAARTVANRGSCKASGLGLRAAGGRGATSGAGILLLGAPEQRVALIADADSRAIHRVRLSDRKLGATTWLRQTPRELLALDDGRVVVSLSSGREVQVLEAREGIEQPMVTLCSREVPTEPWGLARTSLGELLVTSGVAGMMSVLSPDELMVRQSVPVARDPRSVVVGADGSIFVSHLVGAELTHFRNLDKLRTERIDIGMHKATPFGDQTAAPRRREGAQGYALAVVELHGRERILSPMVSVDPGAPDGPLGAYYGPAFDGIGKQVATVAVVDAGEAKALGGSLLATSDAVRLRGCLLPRAAQAYGDQLLVACLGIDALLQLDARALDPMAAEIRRVSLPKGPSPVAVSADQALVFSQFAGKLSFVDLTGKSEVESVALDYQPTLDIANNLLGRELFYRTDDSRIAADGVACASCHPEGRDDSLSWLTSEGMRQTLPLSGRLEDTGPYGWVGQEGTARSYVRNTVSRLGGQGIHDDEVVAIVNYIEAMPAPPKLALGSGDPLAEHGKELFYSQAMACGSCHVGAGGVDHQRHAFDRVLQPTAFGTPSLRGVAHSAPYFHDGRYPTLEALLGDPGSAMAASHALMPDDRDALLAFLRTL